MRQTADGMPLAVVRISEKSLNNLRHTDNVVLIAISSERLQALINEVDDISKEFQL